MRIGEIRRRCSASRENTRVRLFQPSRGLALSKSSRNRTAFDLSNMGIRRPHESGDTQCVI